MKLNRTALIAAAVAITAALAVGAIAQTRPGTKEGGQRHHARMQFRQKMAEKLNLTETQKEKLKAIRTDLRSKAQAIKGNESVDRAAKREQFKALRDAARLQIGQVLTPDQQNQIKAMREQAKARREERRAKRPAQGRLGRTTSA
jgi:Spy/CpxP family protein refolding chaperone